MYGARNPRVSRMDGGRWQGPAKVFCVENPSAQREWNQMCSNFARLTKRRQTPSIASLTLDQKLPGEKLYIAIRQGH